MYKINLLKIFLLVSVFTYFISLSKSLASCGNINFIANKTEGCEPELIRFVAQNVTPGSTLRWDFGNGVITTNQDTIFRLYTNSGQYNVSLRVTLSGGQVCNDVLKQNFINITSSPNPVFNVSKEVLCDGPAYVTFTDVTPNSVSRDWIVEGQLYSNANSSINHFFGSLGDKSVTLRVTNAQGCVGTKTVSDAVKVRSNPTINVCNTITQREDETVANFTVSTGNLGDRTISSYNWSFPGGSPSSSTQAAPTVVYDDIITGPAQDVSLLVTLSDGCQIQRVYPNAMRKYINVSNKSPCIKQPINLSNNSSGDGRTNFQWNFIGAVIIDGNATTGYNVMYGQPGEYNINFGFRYGSGGCIWNVSIPEVITVKPPRALLSVPFQQRISCDDTLTVKLVSNSVVPSGATTTFTWNIYDSVGNLMPNTPIGPSTENSATYLFPKGIFDVELIVQSSNGCVDTSYRNGYVMVGSPVVDFDSDKSVFCVDDAVSIMNETKPIGTGDLRDTYYWRISHRDSINKFFESGQRDFYFFPKQIGYYNVRLIVENVIGCRDTKQVNNFFFVQGIQAEILANEFDGCPQISTGLKARIYGSHPPGMNNLITYEWHIGDQNQSIDFAFTNPNSDSTEFVLKNPGCYNPNVKINNVVCELNLAKLNICAGVVANFGYDEPFCKKTYTQLIDSSFLSPETYQWSVSPATASFYPSNSVSAPQIYLPDDGCYEITLVVTNTRANSTCVDSITRLVCTQSPTIDFEVDNEYLECAPVIVNFTNNSSNAIEYIWHFGDGKILNSTLTQVSHTYETNNPFGFDVTLVAIDADNCKDTLTKSGMIEVIGPVPEFETSYVAACDSALVEFTDKNQFVSAFLFDYGDGSSADSNAMNTHLYKIREDAESDTVIYYPTLIVRDEFDCIAYFRDSILLFNTPSIDFDTDVEGGCVPLNVTFFSNAEFAYNLYWDFNNDGIIDTNAENALYTYTDTGLYSVMLIGVGAGNCTDTIVKSQLIDVAPKPIAKIQANQSGFVCGEQTILFENLSQFYESFFIEYGIDNLSDSNEINEITYNYEFIADEDSVLFFPKITVINGYGCIDEYTDTLILYRSVKADLEFDDNNTCENVIVEFFDASLGASKWQWDFTGDNVINSTQQNPGFIFEPGTYFITLIAGNKFGCYDTITTENALEVMPIPEADFLFSETTICPEEEILYTDISSGIYQMINWDWDFGNIHDPENNIYTGQFPPPHKYDMPGIYTVTLIVTDENNCRDTMIKTDLINVLDSTLPNPPNIRFVTMSENYILSINWDQNPYTGFRENRLYFTSDQLDEDVLLLSSDNPFDTAYIHDVLPENRPLCYYMETERKCELISNPSVKHCAMHLQAGTLTSNSNLISWTPYIGWGNQLDGYELHFKKEDDEEYELLAEISPQDTFYIHEELCDFNYCYYVKAIHRTELYSSVSNTACNRPPYQYQNFPLSLRTTTVIDDEHILTIWEEGVQPNIYRYILDRMDTSGFWDLNYGESEVNSFIDRNANVHGQFYTYRVRVEDICGNTSPNSNIGRSILLTSVVTEDMVNLKWNSYREWPGDVHRYVIEIFDNNTRSYNEVIQLEANARDYKDVEVYPEIDTAYCYRITAIENALEPDSSFSNISCALLKSRVFIPNAFSPNGNKLNEKFKVSALSIFNQIGDPLREFQMQIFDRWGSKIFETNNLYEGWDGTTRNNNEAPAGVYVYVIRAVGVDGITFNVSGSITLVR